MIFERWYKSQNWTPHQFQIDAYNAVKNDFQGIVNAPTGSGKTYSLFIPILEKFIECNDSDLFVIWVSPVRSLTKEIFQATSEAIDKLGLNFSVEIRTGDTSNSIKKKQNKKPPNLLITTPESLHVMLAKSETQTLFQTLKYVVVDEWHELLGSKRGNLVELFLLSMKIQNPKVKIWGISATIGNLDEAMSVLLGENASSGRLIKAKIDKKVEIYTIMPDEIETLPWSGHLGIKMLEKVLPIIQSGKTTLIFTNTRAQCEIWYQSLLEIAPELSGIMAMHHGSLDASVRHWVEDALYEEKLKVVVCTSSLDLGVDFRPVNTIIQVGSPKGVSRFLQRAGRSGHRPGEVSKIYFIPTHSLEILEGAALREAHKKQIFENQIPYVRSFDVLVQYLMTLACSGGFDPVKLYSEIKKTHCFESLNVEEWNQVLALLLNGGKALQAYEEYERVKLENGKIVVANKRIAQRHLMNIGTIVSDASITIKYLSGKKLGTVEEWFVSKLKSGDHFIFSGKCFEFLYLKDLDVFVKDSKSKTAIVPAWMGGRMPLSSQLSLLLKQKIKQSSVNETDEPEIAKIQPIIELQNKRSITPDDDEILIEKLQSKEGYHIFFFPFEGRNVHEGLASLIAYRISTLDKFSFSIAMNDYGFELLSDKPIPIEEALEKGVFSPENLTEDIYKSINTSDMAVRKFRDIARISGLIFSGFPGKQKKERHLRSSTKLLYEVISEYEPENILLKQAMEEVMYFQLEENRIRQVLERINKKKVKLVTTEKASPFAFPILAERLRERFSNESIEDKIHKFQQTAR